MGLDWLVDCVVCLDFGIEFGSLVTIWRERVTGWYWDGLGEWGGFNFMV